MEKKLVIVANHHLKYYFDRTNIGENIQFLNMDIFCSTHCNSFTSSVENMWEDDSKNRLDDSLELFDKVIRRKAVEEYLHSNYPNHVLY